MINAISVASKMLPWIGDEKKLNKFAEREFAMPLIQAVFGAGLIVMGYIEGSKIYSAAADSNNNTMFAIAVMGMGAFIGLALQYPLGVVFTRHRLTHKTETQSAMAEVLERKIEADDNDPAPPVDDLAAEARDAESKMRELTESALNGPAVNVNPPR